jgi:hypothetical protein
MALKIGKAAIHYYWESRNTYLGIVLINYREWSNY